MTTIQLSGRELVALYLSIEQNCQNSPLLQSDVLHIREQISKKLCNALSIEQFELLESLYERGYVFSELKEN